VVNKEGRTVIHGNEIGYAVKLGSSPTGTINTGNLFNTFPFYCKGLFFFSIPCEFHFQLELLCPLSQWET